MEGESCQELQQLIQADLDGELTPAEAARVAVHIETCPACASLQAQLSRLSTRIREEAPYHTAPAALRASLGARIAAQRPAAALPSPASRRPRLGWGRGGAFGMGFALAACLALAVVLPREGGMAEAVVTDHIRALQPGHLMDVISTDQHTVKPWFDGRLAFAPPVVDLKADGFPLAGGRLDYIDGREAAALVYRSGQHVIDLFVWPSGSDLDHGPTQGSRNGYNFVRWTRDGMVFWAVSDLEPAGLARFVQLLQAR